MSDDISLKLTPELESYIVAYNINKTNCVIISKPWSLYGKNRLYIYPFERKEIVVNGEIISDTTLQHENAFVYNSNENKSTELPEKKGLFNDPEVIELMNNSTQQPMELQDNEIIVIKSEQLLKKLNSVYSDVVSTLDKDDEAVAKLLLEKIKYEMNDNEIPYDFRFN